MRTLLAISLLALSALPGCSKPRDPIAERVPTVIPEISVDELDRLLADHACQAVDANGDATRQKMGVIPGAVLLDDFDSTDGLPGARSTGLVFYCANTSCSASHHAAALAVAAGYTNVKVLPEGIAGWVKAGKPTASI